MKMNVAQPINVFFVPVVRAIVSFSWKIAYWL
jgi:hypothetical protein